MTLREAVADRAQWLDGIKPGWEKLVPLQKDKVDMISNCAPCVADYIFAKEAGGLKHYEGHFFLLHKLGYQDWYNQPGHIGGAFSMHEAMPMWREEISARLARWAPTKAAAVPAMVDA